jgi:transcriptional regulator with XRE-family HTH domain
VPQPRAKNQRLIVFGKTLLTLRQERKLTTHQLADRSGVSWRAISYLEGGLREPRLLTLINLARGLRIDPALLVRPLMDIEPGEDE